MGTKNHIKIAWKGLSEGIHEYRFDIGDAFFASIEYSELAHGEIEISIEFIKQSHLLTLNFLIEGTVNVTCDRCLEPFDQDVYYEANLIVRIGSENAEIDDNIISITEADDELDLTHYIYESIMLSLPFSKVHPDDDEGNSGCDSQMLSKIGDTKKGKPAAKEVDPRWDALKNLKNKK